MQILEYFQDILEKWDLAVKSIEILVLNHTGIQLMELYFICKV